METSPTKNRFYELLDRFEKKLGFRSEIKWRTFFVIGFFHVFGFYWSYQHAFPVKWQTIVFTVFVLYHNALGITCGAHRLWTHKSYSAALPLRILLMIAFSSAGQNSIYEWVRDHRLHHKFSDTEADPHNVNRGFTFAHIGWLMMRKNSLVLEKGRQIDLSDILEDPVVVFEHKYSNLLSFLFCYLLPTSIPILLWGEQWQCAVAWQCFMRVLLALHSEMTVNSFAHMFGYKPYNKNIKPTENRFVSFITTGEGYHNYHHMFPNDYKAAETFDVLNFSTFYIRFWAKLGLAWDLKEPSPELIRAVIRRHGGAVEPLDEDKQLDGSYEFPGLDDTLLDSESVKRRTGFNLRVSSALG